MVGEYGPGSCKISKTKKTPFERNHVPLPMKYIEKKKWNRKLVQAFF